MTMYKSRYLREVRITIALGLITIMLGSCQNYARQPSILPTPTFIDPHYHVVDVNQTSLPLQALAEFEIVEVTINPSIMQKNVTLNHNGTFKAFTTHEVTFNIFVKNTVEDTIVEIRGFPSPWRPFSDLIWLTDEVLVFDRWSNPHYGIHYVVNIRERKLLVAAPFPDQMPLQEESSIAENE